MLLMKKPYHILYMHNVKTTDIMSFHAYLVSSNVIVGFSCQSLHYILCVLNDTNYVMTQNNLKLDIK